MNQTPPAILADALSRQWLCDVLNTGRHPKFDDAVETKLKNLFQTLLDHLEDTYVLDAFMSEENVLDVAIKTYAPPEKIEQPLQEVADWMGRSFGDFRIVFHVWTHSHTISTKEAK